MSRYILLEQFFHKKSRTINIFEENHYQIWRVEHLIYLNEKKLKKQNKKKIVSITTPHVDINLKLFNKIIFKCIIISK